MRPKTLALSAGVLLVVAIAAIAVAAHLLDPRALAVSLAASVKADTGRELSLGAVEFELLPRPALVLSELRLGNAAWGSQPWLVQVGRASAELDVLALLSRRLRIKHVELTDASLYLETDRAGKGNWVMEAADAGAGRPAPAWLDSLQIDGLALRSLAFTYRNGATGKARSVQLEAARIDAPSAQGLLRLSVRGSVAGSQVEAAGTIGALKSLLANAPAYPVELEGRIGAANLSLRGNIDKPRELGGLKLALSVQAPQFAELAAAFGASAPPLGPLRGTAQLTGSAAAPALSAIDATLGGQGTPEIRLRGAVASLRGARGIDLRLTASATRWWRFGTAASAPRLPPFRASARLRDAQAGYKVDDLELKIADSTVSASLQVVQGGPRLRFTGKAAAPLVDLARLAPEAGTAAATPAAARPAQAGGYWKLADLDLDLQIARLVLPSGRELRSASGRLALDDGLLKASALQASAGGAKVTLEGSVADPQHLAGLELGVALQGSELAELFRFFGASIPPVGPYQGRARVQGSVDALRLAAIEARAGRPGQEVQVSGQIDDALRWQGIQLAIKANVGDSVAAGRVFGAELPRLPALRAAARLADAPGGYAFDDLKLALGRTSMQGRVAYARGEARPRITAELNGPLVDLSELRPERPKPGATNPFLAADVDATVRFDRVVLANRRALGPVSGALRLEAGALELKQFTLAVQGASTTLEGRIGDPLALAALDLRVNIQVADAGGLEAIAGQQLPVVPAFTASGRLTDVPDGYSLAGLKFAHAAATIAGDLAVTRGAKRFKLVAKGSSPLLDASTFAQSGEKNAKPKSAGARAFPDVPLPLNVLRAIDADLDLRFDAVRISEAAAFGPLVARAVIADGRLKAEPVQLEVRAGQALNISGSIDAAQGAWAMRVEGKGIDFGELLARLGRPGVVTGGSTDVSIQLQGRGSSLTAILGSLNGDARVAVGAHRINNFAINLQSGLVFSTLALANPFNKSDPDTDVRCLAVSLPVRNGVLTSERNIALETAKYNLVASGTVNLRTERVDMALTPVVRKEAGTIVRLGGTLAAPEMGLDMAGAAKSTASLGVAVVMPAWLIADSLIKKAVSDPNPCATALAR